MSTKIKKGDQVFHVTSTGNVEEYVFFAKNGDEFTLRKSLDGAMSESAKPADVFLERADAHNASIARKRAYHVATLGSQIQNARDEIDAVDKRINSALEYKGRILENLIKLQDDLAKALAS